MARTGRQLKLIEIINKNEIETQEALAEALRNEGYLVTQATVSRDIKDLGLIKVMTPNKTYKYAQPASTEQKSSGKMLNLFRECVISIDYAGHLIVAQTRRRLLSINSISRKLWAALRATTRFLSLSKTSKKSSLSSKN